MFLFLTFLLIIVLVPAQILNVQLYDSCESIRRLRAENSTRLVQDCVFNSGFVYSNLGVESSFKVIDDMYEALNDFSVYEGSASDDLTLLDAFLDDVTTMRQETSTIDFLTGTDPKD